MYVPDSVQLVAKTAYDVCAVIVLILQERRMKFREVKGACAV